MDIPLMSMLMSQGQLQQQVFVCVMRMTIGNVEQQGEAIQNLIGSTNAAQIQHAAQPHLGGNIDLKL
ncbi:YjfB family protein [Neobacillus niacini]|uniref:YjfB family protein n=1 Tax=Neobacillus niacini TaxID=86668 RepID=UPI0028625D1D|nr:YjfB family protein [Neobacillus niacini]MDR7000990.1 hypothetical protein [Neobacillus niacini]